LFRFHVCYSECILWLYHMTNDVQSICKCFDCLYFYRSVIYMILFIFFWFFRPSYLVLVFLVILFDLSLSHEPQITVSLTANLKDLSKMRSHNCIFCDFVEVTKGVCYVWQEAPVVMFGNDVQKKKYLGRMTEEHLYCVSIRAFCIWVFGENNGRASIFCKYWICMLDILHSKLLISCSTLFCICHFHYLEWPTSPAHSVILHLFPNSVPPIKLICLISLVTLVNW